MDTVIEIILVEDNPYEAELAIRSLKKNGLANNLIHFEDGAEVLDYIFNGANEPDVLRPLPKLILLDLKLPKVDGIEVLRQLKEDPKTKMIPVVIMTSSKEEKDIVESYQLGVNSYLVKPVSFETFTKVINDLGFYWLLLNQTPLNNNVQ